MQHRRYSLPLMTQAAVLPPVEDNQELAIAVPMDEDELSMLIQEAVVDLDILDPPQARRSRGQQFVDICDEDAPPMQKRLHQKYRK